MPPGYFALLRVTNGPEGPIASDPGWLQLWPAEEVAELNQGYKVPECAPDYVGIGSSGGGEMIALRRSAGRSSAVWMIPFIPLDPREALEVVPTVEHLRAEIITAGGAA